MKTSEFLEDPIHDLVERPWSRSFAMFLHPIEREDLIESDQVFSREMPGFVKTHWDAFGERTLLDPWRAGAVLDLLVQSLSIPGDIVECGTYKGGTAILMGLALKELGSDKKIHGFDSFAGLPSPDTEMDKGYKEGQFKSNLDRLREDLETFNLSDCVTLHPGWFADTVPPFLKQEPRRISLLHVDCDLYVSTNDCFPALYDVVEEGGAVILDDFNDGAKGEKRAVHEALEKAGRHEEIVIGPAPQAYFFKGGGDGDKTRYSLDDLIARKGYLKWISNHLETDYEAMLTDFQPS